MKPGIVIDTNVAVVANGRAPQAGSMCVAACLRELRGAMTGHCVLVDAQGWILGEYRRHLSPRGQPGVGDAFFKWLWNNQANEAYCRYIAITDLDGRGEDFSEFPADADLAGFDRADRKFVATAVGSGETPPILNASDSGWWHYREPLLRNGVHVRFVCPELMKERS